MQEEAEWQGDGEFDDSAPIVQVQAMQEPQDHSLSVRRTEEDLIRQALQKHHGNRKKAAEELGMSERTLYRKLPPEYRKK